MEAEAGTEEWHDEDNEEILFRHLLRFYSLARIADYYQSRTGWNTLKLKVDLDLIVANRREAGAPEPLKLEDIEMPELPGLEASSMDPPPAPAGGRKRERERSERRNGGTTPSPVTHVRQRVAEESSSNGASRRPSAPLGAGTTTTSSSLSAVGRSRAPFPPGGEQSRATSDRYGERSRAASAPLGSRSYKPPERQPKPMVRPPTKPSRPRSPVRRSPPRRTTPSPAAKPAASWSLQKPTSVAAFSVNQEVRRKQVEIMLKFGLKQNSDSRVIIQSLPLAALRHIGENFELVGDLTYEQKLEELKNYVEDQRAQGLWDELAEAEVNQESKEVAPNASRKLPQPSSMSHRPSPTAVGGIPQPRAASRGPRAASAGPPRGSVGRGPLKK